MAATVLYLNAGDHELEWPRKLAGIRRYAKAQGWWVEAFRRRDVPARDVPALLRRRRPAGCIVEDTDPGQRLSPRMFGDLPVVYLDSSVPEERRGLPLVLCDHGAVAERAFRELSAGDPPCFAVVPSPSFVSWNALRIRAFEARCARAGKPCRVFSGFANEDAGRRTERLSRWLASLPPHAAVFAANDRAAKDVATAAAAVRRRFPRDYTLLGVDATPETFADSTTPGISSVELDFELAGYLAAKALEGEMSRKDDHGNPGPAFGPLLVVRKESTRGRGRRERHVLEAVEMIRREACEGLAAAALAARFPGSRKHFERRFREAMGRGILDEILHVRLQTAVDLLSRRAPPISSIPDFCGFGTARELQKLFRARFGMSMREWRALHGR